jgi:hypothetical protein
MKKMASGARPVDGSNELSVLIVTQIRRRDAFLNTDSPQALNTITNLSQPASAT